MPIYTQRHQITDYIQRPNWQQSKLAAMLADCKAGEEARALENEDTFDPADFDTWAVETLFWQMNVDVSQYIYSHYDQGTQASFLSLHADPSTPQQGKDAIESVWAWIKQVMAYYYGIKAQLLAGDIVKWNFSQFDATDPGVKLSDFMGQ
jgi:hypothetical protein